jgi:hypothetical protein
MSTKTTFKRIALVTVAAMGFGLLSVVPSTATTQQDTLTLSSATTTIAAGSTSAEITLTQGFLGVNSDTMSVTATLTSGPATNAVMPVITETSPTNRVGGASPSISTDNLTARIADTGSVTQYHLTSADFKVSFAPVVAGTYVITFNAYNMDSLTTRSTVAARAAAVTWTVTVPSQTLGDATSTIVTRAAGVTTGSAATVSVASGSSTAQAATIEVTPLIASVATTGSTIITATITGPGTVGVGSTGAVASSGLKTATYNKASAGIGYVTVWADGTSGTSSIAISVNGTAVGTATVTFTGAAATVTATLAKPVIAAGSTATAGVITVVVKDAAGNGVSGTTLYAVSSGSSIVSTSVTTGSAGAASISLVGKVAGTNTVTIQNVAAGSTATISAAALSVRVGSATESSVTMTLDKATYAPGDQATITVTIKDAAGEAVVDGTYAAFAADVTSTRAMSAGTLPTASVAVGSTVGVKTYLVNVPNSEGAFTISALPGAGMLGAGSAVAISATATVTPSAASVTANEVAQAAADAAAEATDAANAATDAANAAAEAADAATAAAQDAADAVAALSTQVSSLIAGLKAQLTALTNLVIKIQKKVKA